MKQELTNGKLILILGLVSLVFIFGCVQSVKNNGNIGLECISEEEALEYAKDFAVQEGFIPNFDEVELPSDFPPSLSELEPISIETDNGHIVNFCDYNPECVCRPDEGFWIKISCEGKASLIKENRCPFG